MEFIEKLALSFSVSLPFIGAALIPVFAQKNENLRDLSTVVISIFTFIFTMVCTLKVADGSLLEMRVLTFAENVDFYFRIDALGATFATLSSFLWIFVSIYSIGYMRALKEHSQTRFYFMFAVAIGSALGVAYSGNLLTMYMFYEILSLSTYPLVLHKETEEALKAGRKYLAYLLSGAGLVLFSMILLYLTQGTTDFYAGGLFDKGSDPLILGLIFFPLFLGFGTKAAIMPFHEWLPTAMIAPTPVSALLHAVAVVKAGVFCVLRTVLYIVGPDAISESLLFSIPAILASFTIIVANVLAISENNLKKRLAFSTINNLSIVILGTLLLTPSGIKGSILHMVYHGFMKITLFMCAGAIYVSTRKELVSELVGVGRKMPYTMFSFGICAIGLVGIPPVCGFLSKWYLCVGAIEKKEIAYLLVFLTSALLDAVYLLPIVFRGFSKDGERSVSGVAHSEQWLLLLPILVTSSCAIFLFLFPDSFFHFYGLSAKVARSVLEY
ncbi:MAG: proton-conducting transporter membrane subunit [Deltaproteobacteria bacterium]|nr:proton-conducting transporter membrane subunit [Deltaproteobacteria bacterium]